MIDRKNFLVVAGTIIFVVVVGVVIPYFVYQHRSAGQNDQKNNPAILGQNEKIVNVTYTKNGFDPKDITVAAGTTVVWTNKSGKLMWVASDPHPSHTNLSGFDELLKAKAGADSSYKYRFMSIGTWRYHNHLSPNDKGEVIVQ